ncbi:MAG: hypothetical protein IKQ43_06005 [Treponema sp.]|nr:hypothetical protein [Treponema sp.]
MDFTIKPQREYKDRLFKAIFGRDTEESKRWRLDLYNALNNTNYTDPDALEVNTIENVIYITMKNDVSFLVDSEMNLYEQQSTHNPNMPLRGLMYFSQLYQVYLTKMNRSLLSSKLVRIPTPKFIVFYNGNEDEESRWEMKLSDAFMNEDKSGDFEWTADIININPKCNEPLQKNCKALYDYIRYVYRIKDNRKSGMDKKAAVEEAMDWAIKEKLLGGFFKEQKEEVTAMSLTEYDEEEFKRVCREDGYEDGLSAGMVQGASQKAMEDAENFLREGIPMETVSRCIGLPLEQVKEIATRIAVMHDA